MRYLDRPALRNQWGLISAVIILSGLLFYSLKEARSTGSQNDSGFLLTAFGLPVLLLCLIIAYRHFSWRFTIANGVIESRHGLVAREVRSVRVEDVRGINVKQTVWQRLLNLGDIEFSSAASDDAEVVFTGISSPLKVKNEIQSMMS